MNVKLYDGAYMPERAHDVDAGADLRTPVDVTLKAGSDCVIDTLVAMEIPEGYFGKLESKSGLHIKHSIVCPGGVVDSGYTGTITVRLENHSSEDYTFSAGDKICQIVIQPCHLCSFDKVEELEETERGESGFGSTGK